MARCTRALQVGSARFCLPSARTSTGCRWHVEVSSCHRRPPRDAIGQHRDTRNVLDPEITATFYRQTDVVTGFAIGEGSAGDASISAKNGGWSMINYVATQWSWQRWSWQRNGHSGNAMVMATMVLMYCIVNNTLTVARIFCRHVSLACICIPVHTHHQTVSIHSNRYRRQVHAITRLTVTWSVQSLS
jgi:hypothetical protein